MNARRTPVHQRGFTLMELIGVMAIIAVMAAVLAPGLTDSIDRAYAAAEEAHLETLLDSLEQHILVNKRIPRPNTADWTSAVAVYADLARSDVEFNDRGYRRRLYVDPQFFSSTETSFPGYTQSTGLTSRPYSPRLMLVSDLTRNAPNPPGSAADFSAIWDQTSGTPILEGEKVKVVRLNLSSHFHRLLLSNASSQQPAFSLEGAAPASVPAAVGGADGTLTRYVLRSSRLSVFFSPYPTGAMNTSTLVSDDLALRYSTDGSNWFWERS